ncbi:MAG: glutamate--tRNA ligase [Phycisphaeraceae bacterium]
MSESQDKAVVTRFAPSPTGALHVGGARTALFNWAFARRYGGKFLLRIEDTDAARSTAAAAQGIIRDLWWLGLDWDEGPDPQAASWDGGANQIGERAPYFQSQRRGIYQAHLETLRATGRVYEDDGALRFRMPGKPITVRDAVLGEVTVQPDQPQMQDFVIFKGERAGAGASGGPTYHFAVVVDDAEMGVTHVIRGQEHLNNTIKHVALQDALGLGRPVYAHIPLIFNPDGSKMSKRDKAKVARDAGKAEGLPSLGFEAERVRQFFEKENDALDIAQAIAQELGLQLPEIDVDDFRRSGYLPEVMCNYLALLGWNPGGDVERFGEKPLQFIAEHFSLDRVQKGSAKFDREKLYAFNHEYITALPFDEFKRRLRAHFEQYHPEFAPIFEDDVKFAKFAEAYQPRCHVLSEPAELGRFFVEAPREYDEKAVKKNLAKNEGEGFVVLRELREKLGAVEPWSGEKAHDVLQQYAEARELKMGKVAQPLRVALTGGAVSPPIDVTLELMGQEETVKRIDVCLHVATGQARAS